MLPLWISSSQWPQRAARRLSALTKPCAQQSGNISCLAQELRELSLISPLGVMNIKCKKCDRRWTLCEIIQNSSCNSEDNYGLEKWNISPNETRPPFCDPAPSSQPHLCCRCTCLFFCSAIPVCTLEIALFLAFLVCALYVRHVFSLGTTEATALAWSFSLISASGPWRFTSLPHKREL